MKARLALRFVEVHLKAAVEYRVAFFVDLLVQFFAYGVTFFNMWVFFGKVTHLNQWTFEEVLFLWLLNVFSYGICGLFIYGPARSIENMVRTGEFDNLLLRPIHPFSHLLLKGFSPLFIAHILLSCAIFAWFWVDFGIEWHLTNVLFLLCVVAGGVLIQGSIMIAAGSLSFWIVRSTAVINTLIYGLRNFVIYPISIYDKVVQMILTFVIPYAFVSYYPAVYFFDKEESGLFHPYIQFGTPLVGIFVFICALLIFRTGINHYQSTGN